MAGKSVGRRATWRRSIEPRRIRALGEIVNRSSASGDLARHRPRSWCQTRGWTAPPTSEHTILHGRDERRQEGHEEAEHRAGEGPGAGRDRRWFRSGWTCGERQAAPAFRRWGPRLRRLAPGVAVMQAADPCEADDVGFSAGPLLGAHFPSQRQCNELGRRIVTFSRSLGLSVVEGRLLPLAVVFGERRAQD
jgi:hypothetical protein